jgi:hypothetical protein
MPLLLALFADLAAYLESPEFLADARHPAYPTAFSRNRKLPLPILMATMLSAMRKSIQVELDTFFGHLNQQAQLMRGASEQAFSQARSKLSLTAIPLLNTWLIARAEHYGFVKRWNGLRLVAADASTVRFGIRASGVKHAALADQILFAMFLPGAELMLAASLHAIKECGERQMLFQHLDLLGPNDLLLLDRGYPAAWLVAVLIKRQIPFCMRVEKSGNSGYTCVRDFLRSGLSEQLVMMSAPNKPDARDYECDRVPHQVRLIRQVAPNGKLRVLMTSLLDMTAFPASSFGDLYHQRWRIEEAFKRLKERLNIEHVTGLSQQAVVQDVSAKIVTDNLQAITALTAHVHAELDIVNRINHAYAHSVLKPLWPSLLSFGRKVKKLLENALDLIGGENYRHRENASKPRKARAKSHKHMTQKAC